MVNRFIKPLQHQKHTEILSTFTGNSPFQNSGNFLSLPKVHWRQPLMKYLGEASVLFQKWLRLTKKVSHDESVNHINQLLSSKSSCHHSRIQSSVVTLLATEIFVYSEIRHLKWISPAKTKYISHRYYKSAILQKIHSRKRHSLYLYLRPEAN